MSKKLIKIVFVLPSLGSGGAEKIMTFLAENINSSLFEPILLVVGCKSQTSYHVENVPVHYLNKSRVLFSVFPIISFFRNNKPDLVMSSVVHLNAMIALISILFPKIKFIGREASVLTDMAKFEPSSNLYFHKKLIQFSYRFFDKIICQSKDMATDLIENFKVSKQKITLINNPITKKSSKVKTTTRTSKPIHLISVSRLSKEKGLDRMVAILSQLKFPFKFTLIGKGVEKENLFKQFEEKKLLKVMDYIPYTRDVESYLAIADVFLQTSYVDGFPNAVIESCAVGTPVIALSAPGGITEIIENGKNGYIVSSIEQFVDCLTKINDNYTFHPSLVSEVVYERFNSALILKKYENVFIKIVNTK